MKRNGAVNLVLLIGLSFLAATAVLGQEPSSVFEKLKTLAGMWGGEGPDRQPVRVTYQVMSDGSAVVEVLKPDTDESMITVYHMDKEDLRLTHFCSAHNQPRMKAVSVSPDARVVSFEFVDATNLVKLTDGHMHSLEISFTDRDHIKQRWTWMENGKKTDAIFNLTREK